MAVQARLDTLHADYSDAKDVSEAQLERLQQDATKLQEEGRGDDVQAASKNIGVKISETNSAAEMLYSRLQGDLVREQQLVQTNKDFIMLSNKLDAWMAKIDDLADDDEYGPEMALLPSNVSLIL